MKKNKVAVLGLDGLSWYYLTKMLPNMPVLKRVINKSLKSILHSYPPVTYASWTSILTGVNPGKHGIFSFTYVDRKTWTQKINTALDNKYPRIHEMLGMLKVPNIMVNPIPDFPILSISNTYIVSHGFFYPKVLYSPNSFKKYVKILPKSYGYSLENIPSFLENYVEFLEETITKLDWNLYWINLPIPDLYLHKNYFLLDKATTNTIERKIFHLIDKIVKILVNEADVLAIVSDHGFSRYTKAVGVNDILLRLGLATPSYPSSTHSSREFLDILHEKHSVQEAKKSRLFMLRLFGTIVDVIPSYIRRHFRKILKKVFKTHKLNKVFTLRNVPIDLRRSLAFVDAHSTFGIYVKKPELISYIIREISRNPCIKWAKPREQMFWGENILKLPEIVFDLNYDQGCGAIISGIGGREIVARSEMFGWHHPKGVFTIYSPDLYISRNKIITLKNYHVTPLIMCLLNVPLHKRMDGIDIAIKLMSIKKLKFYNYYEKWQVTRRIALLRK